MMIGKTRQPDAPLIEETFDESVGRARGVLRRPLPDGAMRHSRRAPSPELSPWIAHYWMIAWDLADGESQLAESVPHPNIHLVFEDTGTVVTGIQTQKFSRLIRGKSQVFGVKFRSGGFRPFYKAPLSTLVDEVVAAEPIFGADVLALRAIVFSDAPDDDRVAASDAFFRARIPAPDENVAIATTLVDLILTDATITTVDQLARRAGIAKRSLQRIFREYVGQSPKWVIRRYRLHEVIERLRAGEVLDWSRLAIDLGYFDQAHLINDFKAMVGLTPKQYVSIVDSASDDVTRTHGARVTPR